MRIEQGLRLLTGILLYASFFFLFAWVSYEKVLRNLVLRTAGTLEDSSRKRMLKTRKNLRFLQQQNGCLYRLEQRLAYSGLSVRWRWLTPEIWILLNVVICGAGYFGVFFATRNWMLSAAGVIVLQVLRSWWEGALMAKNYRLVNENLMKFLDFLGNYSVTAGEITAVLGQISKYLDEPLQSVLNACCYEAQMTGDTSLALLSMAEKIEHPQFKELVRNIEISLRYSADFTVLVSNSRRAVREYMKARQERKSMVREALINMLLLLGMSLVILLAAEKLIGVSMRDIMLNSLPGRISSGIIAVIFVSLILQIKKAGQ